MEQFLKLIAIVPPEPIFSAIRQEQEFIAGQWGSKHALKTPPHITIIPPISVTSAEAGLVYGMAEAFSGVLQPFQLHLRDYGAFKPRVIFIHPVVSPELTALYEIWHQALLAKMPHVLEKYPNRPYHPHVTLAHKDVLRKKFDEMWNYYAGKKYEASFDVRSFCILQHTVEGWDVEKKYSF